MVDKTTEKALSVAVQPGNTAVSKVDAVAGTSQHQFAANSAANSMKAGGTLTFTLTLDDGTAKAFDLNIVANKNDATKFDVTYGEGDEAVTLFTSAANANTLSKKELSDLAAAVLNKDESLKENYTIAADGTDSVNITAKEAGAGPANAIKLSYKTSEIDTPVGAKVAAATKGADAYYQLDVANLNIYEKSGDNAGTGTIVSDMESAIIEIEGQKFAIAYDAESAKELEANGINTFVISEHGNAGTGAQNTTPDEQDGMDLINLINTKLGTNISDVGTAGAGGANTVFKLTSEEKAGEVHHAGKPLTLQIGDTNDSYQKVQVNIDSMSASSLGLRNATVNGEKTLNLSDQDTAGDAIATIKNAVNKVSAQRGRLGALQNRLDHTLNNLDATTENITSAESQIRDVNMAKEMTAYTKNNILAQAAQSMLAQANSMPQGVLQLLQ